MGSFCTNTPELTVSLKYGELSINTYELALGLEKTERVGVFKIFFLADGLHPSLLNCAPVGLRVQIHNKLLITS